MVWFGFGCFMGLSQVAPLVTDSTYVAQTVDFCDSEKRKLTHCMSLSHRLRLVVSPKLPTSNQNVFGFGWFGVT